MGERIIKIRDYLMKKTDNAMSLEVYACEELLVTGCIALLDFDEAHVLASTVNGIVRISGEELRVTAFRRDILAVFGKIKNIDFGDKV